MNFNRKQRADAGFTILEFIIVVSLIVLLVALVLPSLAKAREVSQKEACIANLSEIDAAITLWAAEHSQGTNAIVRFSDIQPYLKRMPVCPCGGTSFADSYSISAVGAPPTCRQAPASHVLAP